MALPSRVFVGITVFGLIATLLTVPYTALLLSGYRPPVLSPVLGFRDPATPGTIAFLVLASLFSIGLTAWAWRSLVAAARQDAKRRRARRAVAQEAQRYAKQQKEGGPPFN